MAYTGWDKTYDDYIASHGGQWNEDLGREAENAAWDWYNNANKSARDKSWDEYQDLFNRVKSTKENKNYTFGQNNDTENKNQDEDWLEYLNTNKEYQNDSESLSKANEFKEANPEAFRFYTTALGDNWGDLNSAIDTYNNSEDKKATLNNAINLYNEYNPTLENYLSDDKTKNIAQSFKNKMTEKIIRGDTDLSLGQIATPSTVSSDQGTEPTIGRKTADINSGDLLNKYILTDAANQGRGLFQDKVDFINNPNDYSALIQNNISDYKGGFEDYLDWYHNHQNQNGKGDVRNATDASQLTDDAWGRVWNGYDNYLKQTGSSDTTENFRNYFNTMLEGGDETRALIKQDLAKNLGEQSWQDFLDVTDDADAFKTKFGAILTGGNGITGMEEMEGYDGDQSKQRYHGQDFMEKFYGRSASDRGQNTNIYSDALVDYGLSPNGTLDQYFAYAVDQAPNLAEMVRTNPEKVKDWIGGNTIELNDVSAKLVNQGLLSPLFDYGNNKKFTLPEGDAYSGISNGNFSLEDIQNGNLKASDFMEPRFQDYATALMNTYLNAADLSNENTNSGYIDPNSVPSYLQDQINNNNRINENLLNTYLNYNEDSKYNTATDENNPGNLSYNIFDNDNFSYTGDKYNGDIDLSALFDTGKKTNILANQIKKGETPGLIFNPTLLRNAINKGRRDA